jgi:C-terminal processing protease CtpA/Prc
VFIAAAPIMAQDAGSRTEQEKNRRYIVTSGCGFLGIYPNNIGRKAAERLGLAERTGAVVAGVVNETGASRAGIQEQDVITAFNGTAITNERQLRKLILTQTPGTWVRLDLLRNGQPMTINAEITSRTRYYGGTDCAQPTQEPAEEQRQQLEQRRRDAVRDLELSNLDVRGFEDELDATERKLDRAREELRLSIAGVREQRSMVNGYEGNTGLGLQKMSPQLAEYFRTSASGALVNAVADDSPALRAGMQAGDVIVAVNAQPVSGPMDAVKAIVEDTDGSVDLKIVRDGVEQTVQVRTTTGGSGSVGAPSVPETRPDMSVGTQREMFRLAGIQDIN